MLKPRAIGRGEQERVLRRILDHLPDDCALMMLGGTACIHLGLDGFTTTKDVDVCVILIDQERRIAPIGTIDETIRALGGTVTKRPEDHSWIQALVPVDGTQREVDFIRGKLSDKPKTVFVQRKMIERIAGDASSEGRYLVPTLTDMVFAKAWAVVDQERLIAMKPEREETSALRRAAFEADARRITEAALDRHALRVVRLGEMLNLVKNPRKMGIETVLRRVGALR